MSDELFRERLADLARHLDLESLSPNAHGVCSMVSGKGDWLHISHTAAGGPVHWTSVAVSLAGRASPEVLRGLLCANLDQALLKGCYFAMDDLSQVVTLRYHEPLRNMDAQHFIEVTDTFVGVHEFWKPRLARSLELAAQRQRALEDAPAAQRSQADLLSHRA